VRLDLTSDGWGVGATPEALRPRRASDPEPKVRDVALRIRISRALPVKGEPVALTVWAERKMTKVPQADLRLFARPAEGRGKAMGKPLILNFRQGEPVKVSREWTPPEAGPWTLIAQVEAGRGLLGYASRPMWVTETRLHFPYWGCPQDQRYVTAVMANEDDAARHWRDRGAAALKWKGGQCYAEKRPEAEDYVAVWSQVPPGRDGILIDEFSSGNAADQRMGKALVELRRRQPNLMIVPYCLGLKGEDMAAGFRASDRVLVECYAADWRSDGRFGRAEPLIEHGLGEKAVIILGIGRKWATTEDEVRRQVATVRQRYPDLSGIGFFPGVPERLSGAVDRAIEDYFLRPALLLTWSIGESEATVRNVGQMTAETITVRVQGADVERRTIEEVPAGGSATISVSDGTRLVSLEDASGRYTVIHTTPPPQEPLPDSAHTMQALAYLRRLEDRPTRTLFAETPRLDKARVKNEDGHTEGAAFPLDTGGRPTAVAAEFEVNRCWFYGTVGLELRGEESRLGFKLAHQDHDRDLEGTSPRLTAWFQDATGDRIHATAPPGLAPRTRYTCVLSHEGGGRARVLLWESGGRLLWDSGPWETAGEAFLDTLRFTVRPAPDSRIAWDAATRRLFVRGVSGPHESPYGLDAWFTAVRIHTPAAAER
jgi:hypothetical protein